MKDIKKVLSIVLFSVFCVISLKAQQKVDDITGYWFTENNESIIYIYKAVNGNYYGKMLWLKYPNEKDKTKTNYGKPIIDKHTQKPLLGTLILLDLKFDGKNKWKGKVYDPRCGKRFACDIELSNDHQTIHARGYYGLKLFGRTIIWKRTKAPTNN